jgi:nicotinamidase-related amidase
MEQVRDKTYFTTVAEELASSHTALIMYEPLTSVLETDEESILATTPRFMERWERLLLAARQHDVPVVYSHNVNDLAGMTGPWLRHLSRTRPAAFLDGLSNAPASASPDPGAFLPRLGPLEGEVVVPHTYYDLFTGTQLAPLLRDRNIEALVLTGLVTESGIWDTARRAAAEGFYAVIVEDCVSSARSELHADALAHLRQHFDVVSSDEVLAIWGV